MAVLNTKPQSIVGPEGDPTGKICIVGDAPGSSEVKLGKPFVGPAGHLLTECLQAAGIIRSSCYITNVIKEKPHGNNTNSFIDLSKKVPVEGIKYQFYRDILKEEIEKSKCNIIIALGNLPLYTLTGYKGINKRRGSVYECTLVEGKKVIPVIHPSSAMRQYIYRHFIIHDLQRAKEESEYAEMRPPALNLIVEPTLFQCEQYLAKCKEADLVAFDIEVSNDEVSCISFSVSADEAISIPFTKGYSEYFRLDQESDLWRQIADILEDENILKLGQNVIFDSTFLHRKFGIRTRPCADTMIASAILFPEFPKGLDFITSIYTKHPYYKDEGKHRIKTGGGSDRDFWIYNAKDSVVLMEAFPKIYKDLERQGNAETYTRQAALIEVLMYCSEHGIRMDNKGLREESDRVGNEIKQLTDELTVLCGFPINPNSPKQLKDYFYITKGMKPYKDRKTKRISVNEEALKRISRKGHKEAKILLKLRGLTKLKGTYLDVKLDIDGRMRCSYNPVGTKSGRLSSGKTIFGTGTNLQNQPPIMKRFMLADEGCVLYNIDLSQAENRVVAYLGPDPTMIDAFESGRDIHSQTAGLIFNKPIHEVSREAGSCDIGSGEYSERFWGKKANHGLNYGLSFKSFALIYEIPENDAKFIVNRYHTAYPGVRKFQEAIRTQLEKNRTIENCYGRKRMFMDRWADPMFKEAYSFIPQSTVADKINEDGLLYIYNNQDLFKYVEILNQVHDSVVFQIPIDVGWDYHYEVIMRIKQSLESKIEYNGIKFSIPIDCEMGLNMKDTIEMNLTTNTLSETYEELNG